MQLARKVTQLGLVVSVCLLAAGGSAAGGMIVEYTGVMATAFNADFFASSSDGDPGGPVITQANVITGSGTVYAGPIEGGLEAGWQGHGESTFVQGQATLEFIVDASELYRLAGSGENEGGTTHATLKLGDTILAAIDINNPGPARFAYDVLLIAGETYLVELSGAIPLAEEYRAASLDLSLAPVPEPGTLALLGGGACMLIAHAMRRRAAKYRFAGRC